MLKILNSASLGASIFFGSKDIQENLTHDLGFWFCALVSDYLKEEEKKKKKEERKRRKKKEET